MKNIAILFSLLLCASGILAQETTPERDNNIYPTAKPNLDFYRQAMESGTATIKGSAFTYDDKKALVTVSEVKQFLNKSEVWLVPYDSYMEEWLKLKMKKEDWSKERYAKMDKDVWALHKTAITNSDGDFTFSNVKTGKYILLGEYFWEDRDNYKITGGGRTVKVYERDDFLYEIVEVSNDATTVDVKLRLQKTFSNRKVDEYWE